MGVQISHRLTVCKMGTKQEGSSNLNLVFFLDVLIVDTLARKARNRYNIFSPSNNFSLEILTEGSI